jgi:peptidoglycan/xylan/chitin deacetylase (PgdA/CDA1 family)
MNDLPVILLCTPFISGLISTILFGRSSVEQTIPGLLFHSVLTHPGKEMSHFPAKRFAILCQKLATDGYVPVSLSGLMTAERTPCRGKPVLLTFDDGLACIHREVLPIIQKHNFNATVFCVSSYSGKKSGWDVFSQNLHLSNTEIRELCDAGIEIGSHTATHACLPYLDEQSVKHELEDSKKYLEDVIGKPVTSLSFPYGCWSRRIWDIAKEAGYNAATLYRGRANESAGLYKVQGVYQLDTISDILAKVSLKTAFSVARARARMMSHFSRGTPVWKYRKEYSRI